MLPWLLVRIGTATSVEGKLEETVVQESNSIHKWTKYDGNKAVPVLHGRLRLSKPENFFKHLRKIVGEEGMLAVFLEHGKSLLTIYYIGFVSFAGLDVVGGGERDSSLLPPPDLPLVSLQQL